MNTTSNATFLGHNLLALRRVGATAALLLLLGLGAHAQSPGDLHTSLNPGTGADYRVLAVARHADGRLIVGGQFTVFNGLSRRRLTQLNYDGSTDTTFDPGTAADGSVNAVAVAPEGKVIVGGDFLVFNGAARGRLARLNVNGSLDTSFAPSVNGTVQAVAVQTDGKVLIAGGFSAVNGTPRNRVARLNADGSLDSTFDPGAGPNSTVLALTLQADGRMLVGGYFWQFNGVTRNRVARLNADGSVDTDFVPGTHDNGYVNGISVGADGKVFVAGGLYVGLNSRILRLHSTGALDTTFNPGNNLINSDVTTAVAQDDGKVVIGGYFTAVNGVSRRHVARLNINGTLDTAFNPGVGASDYIWTMIMEPDGALVAGGAFTTYQGVSRNRLTRIQNSPPLNPPPQMDLIASLTVAEDSGPVTVNLTGIAPGGTGEVGRAVTNLTATSYSTGIVPHPTVTYTAGSATATLTLSPVADANGTVTISVVAQDNGPTAATVTRTFTITVTPVNDAPSFALGVPIGSSNIAIAEDSGPYSAASFASSISVGPANESAQTVSFLTSNTASNLFSAQPVIAANGTLTFTPAANAFGNATVTVVAVDSGGAPGVSNTAAQTFTIEITNLNDPPAVAFATNNLVVLEDAAAVSSNDLLSLSPGPFNEPGMVSLISVANNNNSLFSVQPAFTGGTLNFTPAPNANGVATVTVIAQDDTQPAGLFGTNTFTLTVTPVNDAPTLTLGVTSLSVLTNVGTVTTNLAAVTTVGPANETGQSITNYSVSNDNNALFSVQPTLALNGTLTFTVAGHLTGSATVSVRAQDNGGTLNGGVNLSPVVNVTINVGGPNQVPTFTLATNNVVVAEDSGAASRPDFLTALSAGEVTQTVTNLTTSNNNSSLFSAQPAVAPDGTLTFTPAANANGVATVTVRATDNGLAPAIGTQTFTITVTAVNDAPSFALNTGLIGWATKAPMLGGGVNAAAGGVINGVWYVAGGGPPGGSTTTGLQAYDPVANTWTTKMPAGVSRGAAAVGVIANKLYVAGGTISLDYNTPTLALEIYDPVTDSWTGGAAMSVPRGGAASAVIGGKLYVAGGQGGFPYHAVSALEIYDPTSNSWTAGAPLPTAVGNAVGAAINGKFYVAGGTTGPANVALLQIYDPVSNTWTSGTPLSGPRGYASGGVIDEKLVVVGGVNASGALIPTVEIYDPVSDAWTTGTPEPLPRSFAVAAVINAKLHVAGGSSTDTLEVYAPAVTVAEDTGAQAFAAFATGISVGPANESAQSLTFITSNTASNLFSSQPAIAANGTLTFTPAPNAWGTITVSVRAQDNGGTTNGGVDTSAAQTFTITINNLNDAPAITFATNNLVVSEDAGAVSRNDFLSLSPGPFNEPGTVAITSLVNNNNSLFSVQPAFTGGTLTFTPAANTYGVATVTVIAQDDTQPAGLFSTNSFTITVLSVNDAPTLTLTNLLINLLTNAGGFSANLGATVSVGPPDESTQGPVSFLITNNNNALFSTQPYANQGGFLSFSVAPGVQGNATLYVRVQDTGGTANGGVNVSEPVLVTVNITPGNAAPSFTLGATSITQLEDSGTTTSNAFLTALSPGPQPLDASQTVTLTVVNNNNSLFSAQPALTGSGATRDLTFTPAANASGVATVTITATDNGTPPMSSVRTVIINVLSVNDAPGITFASNNIALENAGAQSLSGFATITTGPAAESSQTVTNVSVSNDNNALFTIQPALAANGTLTFTPVLNASGIATVTVIAQDNGGTANGGVDKATNTFTIAISVVNQPPSFNLRLANTQASPIVNGSFETGDFTGWTVSDTANTTPSLLVRADGANLGIFNVVSTDGTKSATHGFGGTSEGLISIGQDVTVPANASAQMTFTYRAAWNTLSSTATSNRVFRVSVQPVGGGAELGGQTLLTAAPSTFGVQVANQSGSLDLTPYAGQTVRVAFVAIIPAGDTANGAFQLDNVSVTVNTPDFSVFENSGASSTVNFATNILAGPANESAQTVAFQVSNNNNALFSSQPAIAPNGTLTFTPALDANGAATVTVVAQDNGGTANGGVDTSAPRTFLITVLPVNSAPRVTVTTANVVVNEDGAAFNGAVATITTGPADESSQSITNVLTSNDNNSLFSVQPSVSASGGLTFTLAANANGTATVTFTAQDNGGTANGGVNQTTRTLTITVNSVNDAPSFTLPAGPVVPPGQNWTLQSGYPQSDTPTIGYSPDGSRLMAGQWGGHSYLSTDHGVTWVARNTDTTRAYQGGFAFSADGSRIYAAPRYAPMLTSADGGTTWTTLPLTPGNNGFWTGVACSSSGQVVIGGNGDFGYLYTSTDYGATWTAHLTDAVRGWGGVAASSDGSVLAAASYARASGSIPDRIYISTDSGATWTPRGPTAFWVGVACSSDGSKLVGTTDGGQIHTSTDGGVTWTARESVRSWGRVVSSADGNTLLTTASGVIYRSTDAGGTWMADGSRSWRAVTMTADGSRFAAVTAGGGGTVQTSSAGAGPYVLTVLEDSGAYAGGASFATSILPGPVDESAQTVSFNVSNNNNPLFSSQPEIAADGTLTFSPAANAFGSATVTVTAVDSGSGTPPNVNTSAAQTFTITVTPVNDQPTVTLAGNVTRNEDSGAYSQSSFATFSAGNASESGQAVLAYTVSNSSNALFSVQPAINTSGTLTFTPAANAHGVATVTVSVQDNGGTANGGVDTSASVTFTITVGPANDAPSFALPAGPLGPPGVVWTARESNRNWMFMASSADGTKLAAVVGNGQIYTSSDSGATWTARDSSRNWAEITMSADGTKLAATVTGGQIYTSSDSGVTWTARDSDRNWRDITSSADGTKLAAVDNNNGRIYTSSDSGVTWTPQNSGNRSWTGITMTPDGSILVATHEQGMIYRSSDSGVTWTALSNAGPRNWRRVCTSADGTKLVAGTYGDYLYASSDSGATWAPLTSLGTGVWYDIACSSDGTKLVTGTMGGRIFTSTDSGATWTAQDSNRSWLGMAMSADGTKLAATVQGGQIYTSAGVPGPYVLNVLEDSGAYTGGANLATSISPGPADESAQVVDFLVSNDNNALFSSQPAVDASGTLTFTPAANAFGTATVTVRAHDDGGTANGGVDTSAAQTFTINVTGINEAPTVAFSSASVTALEDSGTRTVNGFATVTSFGSGETGQTLLGHVVTSDNTALFSVQPAINTSGVLTFTPATNAHGSTTVTVVSQDNGGTANGGVDKTTNTFTITITPVNDAPGFNLAVSSGSGGGVAAAAAQGPWTVSTTVSTGFNHAAGVVTDSAGNVFACNAFNNKITKITPAGVVSDFATGIPNPGWMTIDPADNLYVTATDANKVMKITAAGVVSVIAGDGTGAHLDGNGIAAQFAYPTGIARDSAGNLYVAEGNGNTIRKITPAGDVTTIAGTAGTSGGTDGTGAAARFNAPMGMGIDSAGNLYVGEQNGHTIRKITPAGVVTTVAGLAGTSGAVDGTGSAARFASPQDVKVDAAGNLLVADYVNSAIRQVTPAGEVTTIIGALGSSGFVDGNDSSVRLGNPRGLWVDAAGTVYIGEWGNNAVRKAVPAVAAVAGSGGGTSTPAGETWTARESNRQWEGVASSADGTKVVAVVSGGQIYTSTDSGATWTARESNRNWREVASSADGVKLVALEVGGQLYTSTDSGVTWTARASVRTWYSVASSADGTKLVAVELGGQIYTSTDSGVTWTARESNRDWRSVASSADGTKLVAVANAAQIYTSTDSGVTWTARDSSRGWQGVASSADGTKLVATVQNGGAIYTSSDSGVTWTDRGSSANRQKLAMSADGTVVLAVGTGDKIYTSTDSGATWTARDSVRNWRYAAMSADGVKMVATDYNGQIYTSVGVAATGGGSTGITVAEGSGAYTLALAVTNISAGPANESAQVVDFLVSNDNNALFSSQPAIAANGTLTFTPAGSGSGTATVTVRAHDNGGTDNGGVDTSAAQTFTIIITPVATRVYLSGATPAGPQGDTVVVPILLDATGTESAVGFTLNFDPSKLTFVSAANGADALSSSTSNLRNGSQSENGRVGILITKDTGLTFAAGTRELIRITFTVNAGAALGTTPVTFTDVVTRREVADALANAVPAAFVNGSVTITAATVGTPSNYEGDVAPRPFGSGDGSVTVADTVQISRFAAGLDIAASANGEFQRADCAPLGTKGDGRITVADWLQSQRFAAALDTPGTVGGPTMQSAGLLAASAKLSAGTRVVRVAGGNLVGGQVNTVSIQMDAQGNEAGVSLSLAFDPTALTFVSASVGSGANGGSLVVNSAKAVAGKVGLVVVLPAGSSLAAGTKDIITVSFRVTGSGNTVISLTSDSPVVREVADVNANVLGASYQSGTFNIILPAGLKAAGMERAADGSLRLVVRNADGTPVTAAQAAKYEVHVTSNLGGSWTVLPNALVVENGALKIVDPAASGAGLRLYKLVETP